MVQEMRERTGGSEVRELRDRTSRNEGNHDTEMEEITQGLAGINQEEESDSDDGMAIASNSTAHDSEDEGSVSTAGSAIPSLSSSASSSSSESSNRESAASTEDESGDETLIPQEVLVPEGEGPITSIRDQFREYCESHPTTFRPHLTDAEVTSLKLLDIMFKKKTALNAHRPLMEWHLRASGDLQAGQDLKDSRGYISREATMKSMRGRYNMDNKYPHTKKVKLPISGEVVRLTLHDPASVVQSLLTDPRLEDSDFCFHDDNPLAPPPEPHTIIRDVNTGMAHRRTYQQLIDQDPTKRQQLLPIILYVDGSSVTHFKDFEVIQLKVSFGTFTREARLKDYTWRTLGYIEKVHKSGGLGRAIWEEAEHMESEGVGSGEDDGESTVHELEGIGKEPLQDLHAQLKVMLEQLDPLFERGFLWDQKHKGVLYRNIHYRLYVVMARCDNKEAMALCGQFGQLSNAEQLCRMCHVPVQEADDHMHEPKYKTQPQISRLVERGDMGGLREISQHYLLNAFHDVPFHMANKRGIHGACPVDMLHTVLLGLFKYVRDVFFHSVGPTSMPAKQINGLSKVYARCFSRQSDKSLPPMRFSKGIQEGKLMGKEYRGVLLLILVMVKSQAGVRILKKTRKGGFKTQESIDDWALLLEQLLLMEGYLNVPEMEVRDLKKLQKGIRYIMYLTRMVAQRSEGMGLKLLKFHSLLHVVDNIALYGVPLECDTSANESHHKPTKQAAKLTQMIHETFNLQTGTRLIDFEVVDYARCEMEDGKVPWQYYQGLKEEGQEVEASNSDESTIDEEEVETKPMDAMIQVYLNDQTNKVEFKMVSRSRHKANTQMHPQLLEFLWDLQELLHLELRGEPLKIYTRIVRGGKSFRGHPNYRGKGPWRDWVWVDYGKDGTFPCQIRCFAVVPPIQGGRRLHLGGTRLQEGVFAVVESGRVMEEKDWDLEVLTPFEKDVGLDDKGDIRLDINGNIAQRRFYLADTNAFKAPCCVVPDLEGPKNRYFVVTSRDEWPDLFLAWLYEIKDQDLNMNLKEESSEEGDNTSESEEEEKEGEVEDTKWEKMNESEGS